MCAEIAANGRLGLAELPPSLAGMSAPILRQEIKGKSVQTGFPARATRGRLESALHFRENTHHVDADSDQNARQVRRFQICPSSGPGRAFQRVS
jgi:hypothetical protein